MTTQKEKPPAQVAGVQGFNAFTTPADEQKSKPMPQVDWAKLAGLPPFAMFAQEVYGVSSNNLMPWVSELIKNTQDGVYQQYCDWHAAKGYWKGETPMGDVINGD